MNSNIIGGTHSHKYEHLYKGSYPDGANISTELCHGCGMVHLKVVFSGGKDFSELYLHQPQVNELAYALLKGNNRFAHVLEHQLIEEGVQPAQRSGV
jgi:hypothetical protein